MNLLSPQWIMVWFMLLVTIGFAIDEYRIRKLEKKVAFVTFLMQGIADALNITFKAKDDNNAIL